MDYYGPIVGTICLTAFASAFVSLMAWSVYITWVGVLW